MGLASLPNVRCRGLLLLAFFSVAAIPFAAPPVAAQAGGGSGPLFQGVLPSDQVLEEPEFEPEDEPPTGLPPIPAPTTPRLPGEDAMPGEGTMRIRGVRFVGNTVIDDATLAETAEPFLDRELTVADVEALRDALTATIVSAGYLTSGAVLPEQVIERDGVLEVQIVEGVLSRIDIEGNRWVRGSYYEKRIARGLHGALHAPSLERRIRRLQRDPLLSGIHATIRPGDRRGEAILEVEIEERTPISAIAEINNQLNPSLGEVRGGFGLAHRSLTGFGDRLSVTGDVSDAGGGFEVTYELPVSAYDTTLRAQGRYRRFDLSSGIGEELDIESDYWSAELGIHQPIFPPGSWEGSIGLVGDLRESTVTFLDTDEPFPLPGADDGRTRVAALRLLVDGVYRQPDRVLALQSVTTLGVKLFGATRNGGPAPETQFISWLFQAQALQRVTEWKIEIVAKAALQLSNRRLFGLEQFGLGGYYSVRGYRENQIVRDEGASGRLEVRIPLHTTALARKPLLQLVPFVDAGRAFSRHRESDVDKAISIASVGVGTRFQIGPHARGELFYAHPLRDLDRDGDSLQDLAIHFRFFLTWP